MFNKIYSWRFYHGLKVARKHIFKINEKYYVYNKSNDTIWEVLSDGAIRCPSTEQVERNCVGIKYNF